MRIAWTLISAASLWAANGGLPARNAPVDYPVQGEARNVTVAAEYLPPDQVKGSFSTDLSEYAVFEVGVYPKGQLDVQSMDFALRMDGRMVRPVEPRGVAGINQRKGQARGRDIVLYPTVGVSTGTWGTGGMGGVGVGVGGQQPGPASTDADRRVMEQELADKALVNGATTKPVAGYLYFPVGKKRSGALTLEYQGGEADVSMTVSLPKTK